MNDNLRNWNRNPKLKINRISFNQDNVNNINIKIFSHYFVQLQHMVIGYLRQLNIY
jgi:hypothetical protein